MVDAAAAARASRRRTPGTRPRSEPVTIATCDAPPFVMLPETTDGSTVQRTPPRGRFRWYIGGLLFLSTVINYIDRQTLSVLAPYIKTEYRWTNADFALLIISFRVAYAFGQTASGRFLDRVGTRRGLSLTVAFYSVAAVLTSLATGFRS